MVDVLETENEEVVMAVPSNAVLERVAEPLLVPVRDQEQQTGSRWHAVGKVTHKATSWPMQRRIIIKAEVASHPMAVKTQTNLETAVSWAQPVEKRHDESAACRSTQPQAPDPPTSSSSTR